MSVKTLGKILALDSGTLTPLLKRLETKKLVKRVRSKEDERVVNIHLTARGEALQEQAARIPQQMQASMGLTATEVQTLKEVMIPILERHKHQD